jgi:hypothetical protein
VVFTSANWNVPQTVTVTGLDDDLDDGNVAFTIVTGAGFGSDPAYSGLAVADVSVSNTDNDTAGILVNPGPQPVRRGPLLRPVPVPKLEHSAQGRCRRTGGDIVGRHLPGVLGPRRNRPEGNGISGRVWRAHRRQHQGRHQVAH